MSINTDDRDDDGEEGLLNTGLYVDGDQLSIFVHRDEDGNFVENMGERNKISKTSTTDPWAAHQSATFITKKLGNLVTLQIPNSISYAQSTSTPTIVYQSVIQQVDRPRVDKYQTVVMEDAGVAATGYVHIEAATGHITFTKTTGAAFSTGLCGVYPGDVTWECKI